jgi:MoaA/NifB/PqqE/SkfB family radical SAM enzyme
MKLLSVWTPSHEALALKWFLPSILDDYEVITHRMEGEPDGGTFLEPSWSKAVRFKSRKILDMIESHPGESFVYSDVDLRFYRPSLAAVEECLSQMDLACQMDDPEGNLCTGFVAMRAVPAVHQLWSCVHEAVERQGRDQNEFNRLVRLLPDLRWGYLPLEIFGLGTFQGLQWKPDKAFYIPANPILFHANWSVGVHQKLELLQKADRIIQDGPQAIQSNNRLLTSQLKSQRDRALNIWKRNRVSIHPIYQSIPSPKTVRLDVSTLCQLKCPGCPTAGGHIAQSLGSSYLKFENFRLFSDQHPDISQIELSNWGEVFLNPDLPKILRYAHEKGVMVSIQNGANLNKVTPEALDAIVRYRLRHLSCSIDGASQETYATYRINGDFNRVIGHIRSIQKLKSQLRSPFPELRWQFIAFGHNQHEIERARAMALELDMTFFLKLSWGGLYGSEFSPITDAESLRSLTTSGVANREEYEKKFDHSYLDSACHQMWLSPQINHDGRMLGCTINHQGDYGNVFSEGLEKVLSGEKMNYARSMLLGIQPPRPDIPCSQCSVYLSRKTRKDWVNPAELPIDLTPSRTANRFSNLGARVLEKLFH